MVQFLVPVFDRRGARYPPRVRDEIRHELERRFDGWSLTSDRPLPGAWRNPETGEIEHDESWRYEVGLPWSRLFELDGYLADLAHALGQKALWRVVFAGASGKVVSARTPGGRKRRPKRS